MDNFKKVFLAGMGALSLSKDKAKEIVNELIAEGKIKEKEGRQLAKEMISKAETVKKDMEQKVKVHVDNVLTKVNTGTQAQLKKMEQRIHHLEQKLAAKTAPAAVSKKTTKKRTTKKTAKPKKK